MIYVLIICKGYNFFLHFAIYAGNNDYHIILLMESNLQDVEELLGLSPEKVLLKWMNFHLKKVGYEKQVTNFSSDVKVRERSPVC